MSMPQLVLPSTKYKASYLRARKEFECVVLETHRAGQDTDVNAKTLDQFLEKVNNDRKGVNLPKGRVPQTVYWLVEGSRYIGTISIRHRLNKLLRSWGGHIGYSVRPSDRRKVYGTLMLKLVLPKAKKLGLTKVLITCDETNIGSAKIIKANGGVFAGRVPATTEHAVKCRYWITP